MTDTALSNKCILSNKVNVSAIKFLKRLEQKIDFKIYEKSLALESFGVTKSHNLSNFEHNLMNWDVQTP